MPKSRWPPFIDKIYGQHQIGPISVTFLSSKSLLSVQDNVKAMTGLKRFDIIFTEHTMTENLIASPCHSLISIICLGQEIPFM